MRANCSQQKTLRSSSADLVPRIVTEAGGKNARLPQFPTCDRRNVYSRLTPLASLARPTDCLLVLGRQRLLIRQPGYVAAHSLHLILVHRYFILVGCCSLLLSCRSRMNCEKTIRQMRRSRAKSLLCIDSQGIQQIFYRPLKWNVIRPVNSRGRPTCVPEKMLRKL